MYFKRELRYLKRAGHVTVDVMSLLVVKKDNQVEHYFPANFRCRVMKRRLSTVLGLVSRLFRSCSLPPSI